MDLLFPNIVYAAGTNFNSFLTNVNSLIVNPLITLLFALAVAYFLYGVFEFMTNQANEEKKTTGKMHMLYGVIGITIMMGVFTIMNIILRTLNVQDQINVNTNNVQLNDYNLPPTH